MTSLVDEDRTIRVNDVSVKIWSLDLEVSARLPLFVRGFGHAFSPAAHAGYQSVRGVWASCWTSAMRDVGFECSYPIGQSCSYPFATGLSSFLQVKSWGGLPCADNIRGQLQMADGFSRWCNAH